MEFFSKLINGYQLNHCAKSSLIYEFKRCEIYWLSVKLRAAVVFASNWFAVTPIFISQELLDRV
jgi:hypothetical protein